MKIIICFLLILTTQMAYSQGNIAINNQATNYSAIIVIPFDSTESNVSWNVENTKPEDLNYRYGNKTFRVGKKRENNMSDIDIAKSAYVIEIDSTQYFSTFQLNLDSTKIYTMMDVCNHISIESRNFFRRYRKKLLVLSNFSGQYRFYPVKENRSHL